MSGNPVSEKNKNQADDDPSMEEILASIRKIITDDDKPAEASQEADSSDEDEEVLELTDEVDEVSDTKDTEMNENTNEPASQDDVDALFDQPASQNDVDALFDTAPAKEAVSEPEVAEEEMPAEVAEAMETISEKPVEKMDQRSEAVMNEISEMEDRLLSDATAAATLSSLSGLSSQLMMGGSNQTLEAIVKSVLRPLLRDWLNEHLPVIVEKLVRAEIDKITN